MTRLKSGNLPSTTFDTSSTLAKRKRTWLARMSSVTGSSLSSSSLPSSSTVLRGRITSCAGVIAGHLDARPRQPMAVGGDRLQRALVDDQQHAVQVVADVLLRHRELDELEQRAQVLLRQRQRLQLLAAQADPRIVGGGERLQVEPRASGPDRHLVVADVDVERGVVRQRAQQILQLARADRDGLAVLARQRAVRGDLHLEIRRRHVQAAVALFEQHVGEDRQRVPAFNDAGHGLQRFQERIAGDLF